MISHQNFLWLVNKSEENWMAFSFTFWHYKNIIFLITITKILPESRSTATKGLHWSFEVKHVNTFSSAKKGGSHWPFNQWLKPFWVAHKFNTLTARHGCWSEWISDSYCSLKPLWSGMGDVVLARTSPPLHPPSPPTVLWLPCLQVSQCINCCH